MSAGGSEVQSQGPKMKHGLPVTTVLTTERLRLRVCRGDDVDAVFDAETESVEELRRWFWWCHPEHSRQRCAAWADSRAAAWQAGEEYSFLVMEAATETILGCVWLNAIDRTAMRGSLGYWIRTSCVGRGIASEAARLVVQWALAELKLQRIEIVTDLENRGSQRVAEKLGAMREGIARRRLRVNGQSRDAVVYSVLPGELR